MIEVARKNKSDGDGNLLEIIVKQAYSKNAIEAINLEKDLSNNAFVKNINGTPWRTIWFKQLVEWVQ